LLVGIVADSHDHCDAAREAVRVLTGRGVRRILHAGDWVAPFTAKIFLAAGVPVDGVFGNNDGEKRILAELLPGVSEGARRLDVDGRTVLLVHDRAALPEAEAQGAHAVVSGHTHEADVKIVDGRLEINPGEVGGWLHGRKTLAVWDTESNEVEVVDL
jgi:putative phosphoesterase